MKGIVYSLMVSFCLATTPLIQSFELRLHSTVDLQQDAIKTFEQYGFSVERTPYGYRLLNDSSFWLPKVISYVSENPGTSVGMVAAALVIPAACYMVATRAAAWYKERTEKEQLKAQASWFKKVKNKLSLAI